MQREFPAACLPASQEFAGAVLCLRIGLGPLACHLYLPSALATHLPAVD